MKSDQLNDKFTLILCSKELLWFLRQSVVLQFHIVGFSIIFEFSAYFYNFFFSIHEMPHHMYNVYPALWNALRDTFYQNIVPHIL